MSDIAGGRPMPQNPEQWASDYRFYNLQVVGAYSPGETNGQFKRPIERWAHLENELRAITEVQALWGPNGKFNARRNMGVVCGRCSGNLNVLDLDTPKHPEAAVWYERLLQQHNDGKPLITAEQKTGGGGRQLLFYWPAHLTIPTFRTLAGVDSRGQGGFAMLPPSLHESGEYYEWLPGRSPFETPIAMAPQWLIDAIIEIGKQATKVTSGNGTQATVAPTAATTATSGFAQAFGKIDDLREDRMAKDVFAAYCDRVRAGLGRPFGDELYAWAEDIWQRYIAKVLPKGVLPGPDLLAQLEAQKRGRSEFSTKIQQILNHWNNPDKIAYALRQLPPQGGLNPAFNTPQTIVPDPAAQTPPGGRRIWTMSEFVAQFVPPAYVVDGIVQRGFLYSITGPTGHGKTALSMYLAQATARGVTVGSREVTQGRVLYLAGENPDDIRAKFMALGEKWEFDIESLNVHVVEGVFKFAEWPKGGQVTLTPEFLAFEAEMAALGPFTLVIVDTAAAYFPFEDHNSNTHQGEYARILRRLTFLPGKPCTLVNCHPVKNARADNLIPLGGSSFINEVDGNLTLWREEGSDQTTLWWQGKFRGPEFDAIHFRLARSKSEVVRDEKDRSMFTVIAQPMTTHEMEQAVLVQETAENQLMRHIHLNPGSTQIQLGRLMYPLEGASEDALRTRVRRLLKRLEGDKMVYARRRKYHLTASGEMEIGVVKDAD